MRYATLTLNPCLDHLIALETSFQPGALHRFDSTTLLAGGKGVNVSRMLQKVMRSAFAADKRGNCFAPF